MVKLAASILAADFSRLGEEIEKVEKAGVDILHIDVMDGMFVPNITFGIPVIKALREKSDLFFDVHLMIEEPLRYIEDFAKAGADNITVHVEACRHLSRTLRKIKECGKQAGLALNPATPLYELEYILEEIDSVHIMSVNPGFSFQKFIPCSMDKIRNTKDYLREKNCDLTVGVDGGVNIGNVKEIIEAGVDIVVVGGAVFRGDIFANVKAFKEVLKAAHEK